MGVYEVVKSAVDEMDYMSLLASEAPKDEFETEIQKICGLIKSYKTAEEIAELLAEVFNKAFSANDKPDMFLNCAKK